MTNEEMDRFIRSLFCDKEYPGPSVFDWIQGKDKEDDMMKKCSCETCVYNRDFVADGKKVDTDCTNFHISDDDFIIYHTHGREWYGLRAGCPGYLEVKNNVDNKILL